MQILFVCTGNTCRSPMAQALMERLAQEKEMNIRCDSAGLFPHPGSGVNGMAKKVLSQAFELGGFEHEAQPVTRELMEEADLVVTMTEDHRIYLVQKFGFPEKVITLPGGVGDPYGGDFEIYRTAADQILKGLETLVEQGKIHD